MRRRGLLALLGAAALLAAGCGGDDEAAERPRATSPGTTAEQPAATQEAQPGRDRDEPRLARAEGDDPEVSTIAEGLEVPWDIAFLPDGRAIVTERPGAVRLVDRDGDLRGAPLAEIDTQAEGEGGLLGVAVDPDFADGRRFAYFYVTTANGMEVQRYRMRGSRLTLDEVVLGGITAGSIHDSGRLRFGPDKRLYVATGDAGQGELAQDQSSLNGKILRLDPSQYRSSTTRPTIFSSGHRNPQGLAWQPDSDLLWSTEHGASGFDGPSGDDETNIVRRGRNYGWPEARGEDHGSFEGPVHNWTETVAPSGISFVTLPDSSWTGDLLVATLAGTSLRRLHVEGSKVTEDETVLDDYGRLRAVTEAPDGSLWVTTSNRDGRGAPAAEDDRILRVVPPAG